MIKKPDLLQDPESSSLQDPAKQDQAEAIRESSDYSQLYTQLSQHLHLSELSHNSAFQPKVTNCLKSSNISEFSDSLSLLTQKLEELFLPNRFWLHLSKSPRCPEIPREAAGSRRESPRVAEKPNQKPRRNHRTENQSQTLLQIIAEFCSRSLLRNQVAGIAGSGS